MRCIYCGRNINDIGQDNMSYECGKPICEDCYYSLHIDEIQENEEWYPKYYEEYDEVNENETVL